MKVKKQLALLFIGFLWIFQLTIAYGQTIPKIDSVLKLCDHSFNSGSAQAPTEDDCYTAAVSADIDSDCGGGTIPLAAFCVNLENYHPLPHPVEYLQVLEWPADLPPVYLQYQYGPGVYRVSRPILEWQYIADVEVVHGEPLYKVYQGFVAADNIELDNNDCLLNQDLNYRFSMDIALVTNSNTLGEYDLYPVETYGSRGDLFSCAVFEETCNVCVPSASNCLGPFPPTNNIKVCIDCSKCDGKATPNPSPRDHRDYRKSEAINEDLTALQVSPNPFATQLQYAYQSTVETNVLVRLLSLDGQVWLEEKQAVGIGANQFSISTAQLSAGAYYLQIIDGQENPIQTLIKIE